MPASKVVIAVDPDRGSATRKVVERFGVPELRGKSVLVKPNFNTGDTPPGSTHNDSIRAIMKIVGEHGPGRIVLGERSGPAKTSTVFREKGIFDMAAELGFECLLFDEMPKDRWVKIDPPGSHWRNGFLFARPVLEADAVIGLCCLKTHQYGGHFTMSLKLATGMVHRRNMRELHTSVFNQRRMIAEMNHAYTPSLVVMDGVEAFFKGGPMTGAVWKADLTFAAADRVALDAAGVASLKMHGSTGKIMDRPVFEQDQIKRAVELGLGASGPGDIELVPADEQSKGAVERIRAVLEKG